ncbi:MAG: hypothetical protein WCO51_13120 [bacterium]
MKSIIPIIVTLLGLAVIATSILASAKMSASATMLSCGIYQLRTGENEKQVQDVEKGARVVIRQIEASYRPVMWFGSAITLLGVVGLWLNTRKPDQ